MTDQKFCVNCKHCVIQLIGEPKCAIYKTDVKYDMVTGEKIGGGLRYADTNRIFGECGPNAKLFTPNEKRDSFVENVLEFFYMNVTGVFLFCIIVLNFLIFLGVI